MTKIYLSICLVFLIMLTAFGQVRLGVIAGFQAATHTPADVGIRNKLKAGFLAGIRLDVPLSATLSLRPQVLYSVKGVHQIIQNTLDVALSLNYVEVPVQLLYHADSDAGRLSFGAGLYVAYGLNSRAVVTSGGQRATFTNEFGPDSDQYKRADVGARLSIDFELKSGVDIGIFYAPGFADIANPSPASSDHFALHNTALGISVGYWLKKR